MAVGNFSWTGPGGERIELEVVGEQGIMRVEQMDQRIVLSMPAHKLESMCHAFESFIRAVGDDSERERG